MPAAGRFRQCAYFFGAGVVPLVPPFFLCDVVSLPVPPPVVLLPAPLEPVDEPPDAEVPVPDVPPAPPAPLAPL